MNTNNPTVPVGATQASTRSRRRTHSMIAVGAAAAIAIVTSSAVVHGSGDKAVGPATPTATRSDYDELRSLVNRGVIPRQALEPASMSEDELRDLVNRGVIPRQALDPAPSTTADLDS